MKEKAKKQEEKQEEETLVINVNLTRGLVALLIVTLLAIAVLGYLTMGQEVVEASAPNAPSAGSTGLRQYYMTQSGYTGSNALTACASGYHMASLWEIVDPSNLEYNTSLGFTLADSGQGPPTFYWGWVRTGYTSSVASIAGQANCNGWTNSNHSSYGTYVNLPSSWTAGQDVNVWQTGAYYCDTALYVWCVED